MGKKEIEEETKSLATMQDNQGAENVYHSAFSNRQTLSAEFEKRFDESNLRKMRSFFQCFPIWDAVRPELSWTHYRFLMKVQDTKAREFYLHESIASGWTARQLQHQINTMF